MVSLKPRWKMVILILNWIKTAMLEKKYNIRRICFSLGCVWPKVSGVPVSPYILMTLSVTPYICPPRRKDPNVKNFFRSLGNPKRCQRWFPYKPLRNLSEVLNISIFIWIFRVDDPVKKINPCRGPVGILWRHNDATHPKFRESEVGQIRLLN